MPKSVNLGQLTKVFGLGFANLVFVFSGFTLFMHQSFLLLALLMFAALIINILFIVPSAYPFRYIFPAAFFLVALVLYPIGYTVYVAFTNYGTGNILTMEQVINQFENRFFLNRDAQDFRFQAFRNEQGEFAFIFTPEDGSMLVGLDGEVHSVADLDVPLVDENGDGQVERIGDYAFLERRDLIRYTNDISQLGFDYGEIYQLRMRNISSFAQYTQEYAYNRETLELTDLRNQIIYTPVRGFFTAPDGTRLTPGFRVTIGWDNFKRLVANPQITGPFARVFIWTFQWAILSVSTTFIVGLFLAIMLNDPYLRFRKLYRSLLVLPYAIPAFISALIWRGLYNTEVGVINRVLTSLFNISVPWLQDPNWAKAALVILNLWLGFPYMMIICLGALQSINNEMYEAALVDGASGWQQFRFITFPLLLVSIAPLLVASFSFNFNNFVVVYLLTRGRPPIPGAQTPAGSTDILISYTYRLAFESGRGVDYGLASSVTILIFMITGAITYFNFRFTGALEDVNKNV